MMAGNCRCRFRFRNREPSFCGIAQTLSIASRNIELGRSRREWQRRFYGQKFLECRRVAVAAMVAVRSSRFDRVKGVAAVQVSWGNAPRRMGTGPSGKGLSSVGRARAKMRVYVACGRAPGLVFQVPVSTMLAGEVLVTTGA